MRGKAKFYENSDIMKRLILKENKKKQIRIIIQGPI
jgi:hypothetical protein